MRFDWQGVQYRLVFGHDPSNSLGDHEGHEMTVLSLDGRMKVVCLDCFDFWGMPVILAPKSKKVRRSTHVLIEVWDPIFGWIPVKYGRSRLNVKAGDRFTKRDGRISALEDAVGHPDFMDAQDPSFKDAVWLCYFDRGRKKD